MLEGGVGGEDGVVRLHDGGGDLGCRVDAELELALLAVVDRQTLHEKRTETGTSATTEAVEDEETLETRAVICNAPHLVKDLVDELLADSVVPAGVVVGGILLASDHLFRVEQRAVGTSANLVDDIGLEVGVDRARHVLAVACRACQYLVPQPGRIVSHTGLGEESGEAVVVVVLLALLGEVAVRLDAVLEAVQLFPMCQSMFLLRHPYSAPFPPVSMTCELFLVCY